MKNAVFLGDPHNQIYNELKDATEGKVTAYESPVDLSTLNESDPAKIISYGYQHILGEEVIRAYRSKIINLHISYLPYNRGASPNLWSIVEGTQAGVSVHYIDEGVDTGDVICQKKVELDWQNDSLSTSYQKLKEEIELLCLSMLKLPEKGWHSTKQKSKGTYHSIKQTNMLLSKLKLSDGWDTKISEVVEKSMELKYRDE
jgi:methionyl-tRNA formyltransferase